jgi:hypothetical protein
LSYTFASDQMNRISWLMSSLVLMAGTAGGEWKIAASSSSAPLTPTDVNVRQVNNKGSLECVKPVRVGDVLLFFQGQGRKLRELVYRYELDSWVAPDLTILSEHITAPRVLDMAFQQEPDQTVWVVRHDGVLLSMVYEREQEVVGWSKHLTDGLVEAVACIPGEDYWEVWLVVRREINGATRRYVELLMPWNFWTVTELADMFYVDSGLTYDGAPATVISALDHLEGKTVSVLADGAVHVPRVVTAGEITLDQAASKVQVGLPYTSVFKSVKLEAGGQRGPVQGKIKRLSQVILRLHESLGGKVGPDLDNLETMHAREMWDYMDTPSPLFSGDWPVDFRGDYERSGQFMVVQDQPLPLTLCAVMTDLMAFEG